MNEQNSMGRQQDRITSHLRKRKQILKRFLDAVVLFILTYFIYAVFQLVAGFFFAESPWLRAPVVLLGFSVVIAVLFYKRVDYFIFFAFKRLFLKRSDQYFFALTKLTRDLVNILDLPEVSNLIVNTFGETVGVKTASLMVFDQNEGVYQVISAFGISPSHYLKIRFAVDRPIVDTLRSYAKPLVREKIRKLFPWQEANQLVTEFEILEASCIIPLICNDQLIGSLNLGVQEASKPFRDADIRFFHELAKEIAPVVRNAIMVEELKRANQDLTQVQTELIQSTRLSAIEQLATGLAHEIHNPLTIISGKAQVLLLKKDKKGYDEKVEEVLKTIVKQTKRAADITRKLLMFSQGKGSTREAIAFETIVNDTVALVSYQMALDGIRVVKQIDHHLPVFYGNPTAFREIFLNLLLNAVQAVGKSGTIQISVRYKTLDRAIEIRVADTGIGIQAEHLNQLFNPFFTTRKDATGLGLFVTQQIIHQYSGSIRVESKVGEGTIVIIQLPVDGNGEQENEGPAEYTQQKIAAH
ncbi:MAG: GAF domain-containing protein [Candidatus Omnitrophica bacterium]|nr:GAF domain-containing protein [Candidatus Omnitrophota bacterium]